MGSRNYGHIQVHKHHIIEVIQQSLYQIKNYAVRYYPREGNQAADMIANEIFTFMSNVPKLYSLVSKWLKSHVEVDKPLYGESVG